MRLHARRVVVIVGVAALLTAAVAGAWYVFGEERRSGRIVAEILSGRLGFPVTVERAGVTGARLRLRGVRVPARRGVPVEVKVGEVDIDGGLLPLFAPAGRSLSIVAASTSVTLRDDAGASSPTAAIEALRSAAVSLLDWPGALSLRVHGGELTRGGRTLALELHGEKTTTGLTLAITLLDEGAPVLRLTTQSATAGNGVVTTHVELAGVPSRLGGLWPASWPAPSALAGRADLRLAPGGDMTASARLTAGDTAAPAVIEFVSRWDPARGELVVSRYGIDAGRELHLEGAATLPADGRPLTGHAEGTIDESAVRGRVAYEMSRGVFDGEVTIDRFTVQSVARRLGTPPLPGIVARALQVRFSGAAGAGRPTVTLDFTARAATTPTLPRLPVDAAGTVAIALAPGRIAVVAVDAATVALTHEGRSIGRLTAASRRGDLWPIEIRGDVEDAAALALLLPVPARLTGRASLAGELASVSPPAFRGTVQAQLSDVDITAGGHVTLGGVRATVPVGVGVEAAPPGTLTAERVTAYGFTATRLTSSARLSDGRLRLPDIHYVHYDGEGGGWLEAGVDGRPIPVKARLEGNRVDLAALVRDFGTSTAQISGRMHYVLAAQYTNDRGLAAAVQLASDEGGGEVNIEPIQHLLDSASVQGEASGVLRQALQNLRVFRYESLEGTLTWNDGAGHIDLSLRGRKRLGIFPGPVEAINFRNVPLTVLARTLTRGSTP